MSDGGRQPSALPASQILAQAHALLQQLEELEPRLAISGAGEVELSLLERATELVEEAGRLLERLGQTTG